MTPFRYKVGKIIDGWMDVIPILLTDLHAD